MVAGRVCFVKLFALTCKTSKKWKVIIIFDNSNFYKIF